MFLGYIDNDKNNMHVCKNYSPNDCIVWDSKGNCRSYGAYYKKR